MHLFRNLTPLGSLPACLNFIKLLAPKLFLHFTTSLCYFSFQFQHITARDGEKVTIMVLKVDLQCRRCYKKVKQVLCKFPQIRDQIYDEKANTVTIKVVCCDPEKMRGKIRCKGGDSIKSIEIKPPPKAKDPEKSEKEPEKKTEKTLESEKKSEKPKETPAKSPAKQASPPAGFCCTGCYHGHRGGPCYFGGPPPPPYYWPYGRPVYVNWGGGGGSTYCYCFEENPQCSVM